MNIKEMRIRAGLTQAQLAEAMKVTQSCVAAWERGDYYPRPQSMPTLAKALQCTIDELYRVPDKGEVTNFAAAES